jgi:hypothetical protein
MAKFGNLPVVVIFIEFGREHYALPLGSKSLPHHLGENEEPLLDLVIVQPVLDPLDPEHKKALNIVGTSRQGELARIMNDVPHESHAFSDANVAALTQQGITVSAVYPGGQIPGGRWREVSSAELAAWLGEANEREKALAQQKAADEFKAAEAKAKAEELAAKAKAEAPEPIDDITREALIRNKQEELKAKVEAPATPVVTGDPKPEPVTPKKTDETPQGGGSGTVQ